ncbi:LTA synthase family protein [Schleiferilactobacillus shenzhenensis]|uniref:Sulfatase N-terminal domain-containing protein n=1 Tax=Schleiferilactobacillus shenzhenensis LY-73 TaxID=1231336 RepID=U4TKB7_9LACO|nr:LTA synthase family protein [Schleiferilactobacillus shenzhenensis]ERL64649.1 hypothetical protein L248_0706 [Schleiferilactobacillus shenzhenensis LY-73]
MEQHGINRVNINHGASQLAFAFLATAGAFGSSPLWAATAPAAGRLVLARLLGGLTLFAAVVIALLYGRWLKSHPAAYRAWSTYVVLLLAWAGTVLTSWFLNLVFLMPVPTWTRFWHIFRFAFDPTMPAFAVFWLLLIGPVSTAGFIRLSRRRQYWLLGGLSLIVIGLVIQPWLSLNRVILLLPVLLIVLWTVNAVPRTAQTATKTDGTALIGFVTAFALLNGDPQLMTEWWQDGVRALTDLRRSYTSLIRADIMPILVTTVLVWLLAAVITRIFSASGEESGLGRPKQWLQTALAGIVVMLSFYFLQASSSLFNFGQMSGYLSDRPTVGLIALNIVILLLVFLVIVFLINRFWVSLGVYALIAAVACFANFQKSALRDEPVVPLDLQSISILPELINMIGTKLVVAFLIILVAVLAALIAVQWRSRDGRMFHWKARLLIGLVGIVGLAGMVWGMPTVNPGWNGKKRTAFATVVVKAHYLPTQVSSPKWNYQQNGVPAAFTSMIRVKIMNQPADYSADTMREIANRYRQRAKKINAQRQRTLNSQTVIYILSESYADPSRVPGVKLSGVPNPYLRQIKAANTSGVLDSYGYGGGTANIEFETLTGLSMDNFAPAMTVPYVYVVPKASYLPNVISTFRTKNAIHPFTGTTYQRNVAFKKMGFQDFYADSSGTKKITYTQRLDNSSFVSDQSAFMEVLKLLKEKKQPQFIQLSTMQNHLPYPSGTYKTTWPMKTDLTDNAASELQTYTQGLHYTDAALKHLIAQVNRMKRRVTIVFYGDHLPGIYAFKQDNTQKMKQYDNILHQSDYFIYSNFKTAKQNRPVASANMFTPLMLAQTDSQVSPYYALLTQMADSVPAIEHGKYMNEKGEYIASVALSSAQKKLLHDYLLVQYDVTTGKNYLHQEGFYTMPAH